MGNLLTTALMLNSFVTVCHVIADELQWEISQVDPRKTLEVSVLQTVKLYRPDLSSYS